jgi:hypothetical protein
MNPEQVVGIIRQFLPFAAGIATILGWNKAGEFDALGAAVVSAIGPVMGLASLVWSLVSKTNANIVTSAAKVPGVANIQLQQNEAGLALAPNSVTPPNVSLPGGSKPL